MKNNRYSISIRHALMLLVLLLGLPSLGYAANWDFESQGYRFRIISKAIKYGTDKVAITGPAKRLTGKVILPDVVRYYDDSGNLRSASAIGIDSEAFKGCTSITSVNFGLTIKSIGSGAFEGCTGLTSIDIPKNVTSISDYAFKG